MNIARAAISVGVGSAAAIGILLMLPSAVAADNCASLSDCFATAAGAAAAAVGAAAAALGGFFADGLPNLRNRGTGTSRLGIHVGRMPPTPQGPPVPPGLYDEGFVYAGPDGTVRDQPSDDGTIVAEAPHGTRLQYDDVVRDGSGAPTHYHVNVPGGASGYIPAADTYDARPSYAPPRFSLDRDLGEAPFADVTSTHVVGGRG